jgi:hypothetical protein
VPRHSAVVGSNCQRNYFSRPAREVGGVLDPVGGMPGRTGSFLWSGEAVGHPEGICVRKSCLCTELSANVLCVCLGEHRPTVLGMEVRDLNGKGPRMKTFGTIDGGLESVKDFWSPVVHGGFDIGVLAMRRWCDSAFEGP